MERVVKKLCQQGIKIYSTGGTEVFIRGLGIEVTSVKSLTDYPSIFDGRVKTLHPKIFGGILYRRDCMRDCREAKQYDIPSIDLVIVDLYPFEETVALGAKEGEVIEKIDIGGVALIRAAAKNFNDVLVVSSKAHYDKLLYILEVRDGVTTIEDRKLFAARAFETSSHYDTAIFNYLNLAGQVEAFKVSGTSAKELRYGENPHQRSFFYGGLHAYFSQIHGKEISYNNLLDIESALRLMAEFDSKEIVFAILKHNNACGIAIGNSVGEAYRRAFAVDPVSAFGSILTTNQVVDVSVAEQINALFFELFMAPSFSEGALKVLRGKKNRILLIQKKMWHQKVQFQSLLDGILVQDYDLRTEKEVDMIVKTCLSPTRKEVSDLLFASKVCKQSKSNAIVLARDGQMLASGVGHTSRVDALKQAVRKARELEVELRGAVMASDAFFPFPDCVKIAHEAGVVSIIQPGGSIRDQLSVDYCDNNGMSMVFTGIRHFRH